VRVHFFSLALVVLCATPGGVRAESVLIYDDNLPAGVSDLEVACNLTGDYTCTRVAGEGEFTTEANAGTHDIIMVDLQNSWWVSPGAEEAMLDHIAGGGYAVLHLMDLQNHNATADELGAVVTATHPSSLDVYGGGELFNNEFDGGHSVPNPLRGGTNIGGMDQDLDAAVSDPSATAHFHYDNVITGAPALVTSHDETVVLIGFSPDETGQFDDDSDGIRDVREFLSNCLDYTLSCSDVDADGDGFSPCDGDCNDDDDDINPDALETPGDSIDSNCDGSDGEDGDGDGHGSPESGGDGAPSAPTAPPPATATTPTTTSTRTPPSPATTTWTTTATGSSTARTRRPAPTSPTTMTTAARPRAGTRPSGAASARRPPGRSRRWYRWRCWGCG